MASARSILHTKDGNSTDTPDISDDNLSHILDLVAMEIKMLHGYTDYKATHIAA